MLHSVAVRCIASRLEKVKVYTYRVVLQRDEKSVRRLRKFTRQLLFALDLFSGQIRSISKSRISQSRYNEAKKDLRDLTKILGRARDAHVIANCLKSAVKLAKSIHFKEFGWEEQDLTENLHAKNFSKAISIFRECAKEDLGARNRQLKRYIYKFQNDLVAHSDNPLKFIETAVNDSIDNSSSELSVSKDLLFRHSISNALINLLALEPFIHNQSDIEALHDMRIAGRSVLFAIDLWYGEHNDSVIPENWESMRAKMREFRTCLGNIHDIDVTLMALDGFCLEMDQVLLGNPQQDSPFDKAVYEAATAKLVDHLQSEREAKYYDFLKEWKGYRDYFRQILDRP